MKKIYKYDDKGNEIEVNSYDDNGEVFIKRNYKYKFDFNKKEDLPHRINVIIGKNC